MKATYLPMHLFPLMFPMLICSLPQFIPKNVEILKKLWETQHPMSSVYVSEHVWLMSMLVSDIGDLTLTEVQI